MELVRIIREKAKLNPWAMHKLMGKSIASYQKLERTTGKISLQDLLLLQAISGLEPAQFWRLMVKSAKKDK